MNEKICDKCKFFIGSKDQCFVGEFKNNFKFCLLKLKEEESRVLTFDKMIKEAIEGQKYYPDKPPKECPYYLEQILSENN